MLDLDDLIIPGEDNRMLTGDGSSPYGVDADFITGSLLNGGVAVINVFKLVGGKG
jgi:hypothetical protein